MNNYNLKILQRKNDIVWATFNIKQLFTGILVQLKACYFNFDSIGFTSFKSLKMSKHAAVVYLFCLLERMNHPKH